MSARLARARLKDKAHEAAETCRVQHLTKVTFDEHPASNSSDFYHPKGGYVGLGGKSACDKTGWQDGSRVTLRPGAEKIVRVFFDTHR